MICWLYLLMKTASYLESLPKLANVFKSTLSWSDLEYQGKKLHYIIGIHSKMELNRPNLLLWDLKNSWFVWSVIVIYILQEMFFYFLVYKLWHYIFIAKHDCASLCNFKSNDFFFLLCVWVVLIVNLPYINLHNVINNLKWKF